VKLHPCTGKDINRGEFEGKDGNGRFKIGASHNLMKRSRLVAGHTLLLIPVLPQAA